jgi:hypothetical protein
MPDPLPPLREVIRQSYILCFQEDVSGLADALASEKLNPTVLRASYTASELSFARNTRTFMSHAAAWRRAATHGGYTLICESDFVPCLRIGSFPVFWPLRDPLAWGYLYQGSPRILALIRTENGRFLRGHCAPLVSYVISAPVARLFLEFFSYEMERHDPNDYFTFDAHLQWWTMGQGATAFIPLKHYGEHGGLPNPEHRIHNIPRAGLHRADNLAGRLYYLPQYAKGRQAIFRWVRTRAHALGFARLMSNRWIVDTNVYDNGFWEKLQMYAVGIRRLMQ